MKRNIQMSSLKSALQAKITPFLNILLTIFSLTAISRVENEKLRKYLNQNYQWDLEFLNNFNQDEQARIIELLPDSYSQLRQDLFVLNQLDFKTEGFFVEFGATDGKTLSNTYLLAKSFNWKGILAEPAKVWHKELRTNRSESSIVTQCVWIESGSEVEFKETNIPELSTMAHLSDSDSHSAARFHGKKYLVRTISLNDMLTLNNAPNDPDYLSIDTEGSEYEILSTLDFEKYKFRVITCEHNYSANREKIASLLISKGYSRVRTDISKFDDWFVLGNS